MGLEEKSGAEAPGPEGPLDDASLVVCRVSAEHTWNCWEGFWNYSMLSVPGSSLDISVLFSLSLQPFVYPVCTPEGVVFDLL